MENFREKKEHIFMLLHKHKKIVLLAPIAVLALGTLAAMELKSFNKEDQNDNESAKFNTNLPLKEEEIDITKSKKNYYDEKLKDSLEVASYEDMSIMNLNEKNSTKDSLEIALEKMENFSFNESNKTSNSSKGVGGNEKSSYTKNTINTPSYTLKTSPIVEEKTIKKEEEEEEEESSGIAFYSAPADKSKIYKIHKVIKAKIAGKQTITPNNNIVSIKLLEDLKLGKNVIPENSNIQAVSTFSENRIQLKITSIMINKEIFETDIIVTDSHGYEGIHIAGGTGAETKNEVKNDVGNELSNNEATNKIPGSKGVISKIFSSKIKAKLNPDYVYLKNSQK